MADRRIGDFLHIRNVIIQLGVEYRDYDHRNVFNGVTFRHRHSVDWNSLVKIAWRGAAAGGAGYMTVNFQRSLKEKGCNKLIQCL